jgi:chromosome segregation ATPase
MVEELRRNLTVAEGLVGALQDKLDKAEHSLAKRKSEMQRQQLYYQSQIEELRKDLDLANLESGEKSKAQSARVKQLQQRVHDLEDELRQTKARHSASLEGVRSSLDSKIAASRIQLEAVQRELSDVQALNADYKRQAAVWEERMEIAAASVRASERREEELLKYVEELEAIASSRNDTIRHLQAQIEDLQLELNNERNQTTSDLLVLSQADAIEDLEEQIRNLKHAHAAQLRSERKQFQQDINELQEDFQLKLDGMRVAAAASPTRAAEAAAAVAPSRSPANVARRAWQRMKRPFQRP